MKTPKSIVTPCQSCGREEDGQRNHSKGGRMMAAKCEDCGAPQCCPANCRITLNDGVWTIKGVAGKIYTSKSDIFKATCAPVKD